MQPKKKKKKEGPGVTARNMSEDVRKKMSNAVASQAAGLSTGKYAWMNAAAGTSTPAKTKSTTSTPGPSTTTQQLRRQPRTATTSKREFLGATLRLFHHQTEYLQGREGRGFEAEDYIARCIVCPREGTRTRWRAWLS
jgi:hypothetical protein